MPDIFKIDTDKVFLCWSGPNVFRATDPAETGAQCGRLTISLRRPTAVFEAENWRSNVPLEVAADPTLEVGPYLNEETNYALFVRSKTEGAIEVTHRDPGILKQLSKADHGRTVHGSVNFHSQIGRSRFTVVVGGQPEYDFEVEVFPTKLDYETDYKQLLASVQDIRSALVMEYLNSTYQLGIPTNSGKPTRLEWLLLLRHVLGDLERGLRQIERHPHRGLLRIPQAARLDRVRRPDSSLLCAISQGKGSGPKLQLQGGQLVHQTIQERQAQMTLDTAEHRWFAAQLSAIQRQLVELHAEEVARPASSTKQAASPRDRSAMAELEDLESRVSKLFAIEPIAAADGLPPTGFASIRLQSAPGYREAYQSCLLLRLGLKVDGGPVGLTVKDIHLLYEYWCYLALVKLLANCLGERIPVEQLLHVQDSGLRIQLKRGHAQTVKFATEGGRSIELSYNMLFKSQGFGLPQQPDILLTLRDPQWPTIRLVLDAKYRVQSDPDYLAHIGSPGPPADAINVLHRYRDAILDQSSTEGPRSGRYKRSIVEGVALFPHIDASDTFRSSHLWKSLEHLGIGALPFLPNETRYVEEWLRTVLSRSGWTAAESSIPSATLEQMRSWQQAAKEIVLVGVLRAEAQQHLDWVCKERRYYAPLTPTQRRQFFTRWLAIYSPTALRTPGAVTHLFPVERITVVQRRDIPTPWESSRDGSQQQVFYYLGEPRLLEQPVLNRDADGQGQRFSQNRWTSLLALEKASQLRELFMETEPEWRLYDELRAAGIDFFPKPGRAELPSDEDPSGRAWFSTASAEVQYRGAAGFLIRRYGHPDEYQPTVVAVIQSLTLNI